MIDHIIYDLLRDWILANELFLLKLDKLCLILPEKLKRLKQDRM